jgi:hypothetical protein
LQRREFSILEMGAKLSESPSKTFFDAITIFLFQALYAVAVYIAPLILLVMLTVLIYVPMRLSTARAVFYWTKIVSYWSALDVFLVSMTVSTMQIGNVVLFIADFVTNSVCGTIAPFLEIAVANPDKDAFCVAAEATLTPESVVIFAGLFLNLACFYVITVLSAAALDDRYFSSYRGLRDDVVPQKLGRLSRFVVRMTTTLRKANLDPEAASRDMVEDRFEAPEGASLCCSWNSVQGQKRTDSRVDMWQRRFGVDPSQSAGAVVPRSSEPVRRSSPNPMYRAGAADDDIEV